MSKYNSESFIPSLYYGLINFKRLNIIRRKDSEYRKEGWISYYGIDGGKDRCRSDVCSEIIYNLFVYILKIKLKIFSYYTFYYLTYFNIL